MEEAEPEVVVSLESKAELDERLVGTDPAGGAAEVVSLNSGVRTVATPSAGQEVVDPLAREGEVLSDQAWISVNTSDKRRGSNGSVSTPSASISPHRSHAAAT